MNNISKKDILKYASVFPDKVMRNLIESETIFCVAMLCVKVYVIKSEL